MDDKHKRIELNPRKKGTVFSMAAANDMSLAVMPNASMSKETASSAVAAQAVAATQARYTMALARPRSIDQVRQDLMKECKRPAFAEVARYSKPIGREKLTGPSIRFVETAIRCMRNILVEQPTIYDDAEKRIVRLIVTDLESNSTYQRDVTITKTVERRNATGKTVVGTRLNSEGQTLYIVEATDDEILNKEGALVSKAIRTLGLRIIPGDLIDEAMSTVVATLRASDAKDPDASRRKLLDVYAAINVRATDLAQYLGHDTSAIGPDEMRHLQELYVAIRDGETTWREVMGAAAHEESDAPKQTATSATMEKLKNRAAKDAPNHPPAQSQTAPAEPANARPADAPKADGTEKSASSDQDLAAASLLFDAVMTGINMASSHEELTAMRPRVSMLSDPAMKAEAKRAYETRKNYLDLR